MGSRSKSWVICEKCGKKVRKCSSVMYMGVLYCGMCYRRKTGIMGGIDEKSREKIEDAEEKIRSVCSYKQKGGGLSCTISVPSCYWGKRVRVIVVDEECYGDDDCEKEVKEDEK